MKTTFWDILTVLTLVGIVGLLGIYGLIFLNPYVPFNPFPPPYTAVDTSKIFETIAPSGTLIDFVATETFTPTSRLGPTWTENPLEGATSTIRPTSTQTPSITPTSFTSTPSITLTRSNTPTVTGTPPTATPSLTLTGTPTKTRTPTKTYSALTVTSAAKTSAAGLTKTAYIAKTQNAAATKTAYYTNKTQTAAADNKTATAYAARLTKIAKALTETAAPNATYAAIQTQMKQTSVAATANANATLTKIVEETAAQETLVQATANATATMVAQATAIVKAPIAYGVDTNGSAPYYYEQIRTNRIAGGGGWPIILNMSTDGFNHVDSIGSWYLDDTLDLWYILFSESSQVTTLFQMLYTDETIHSSLNAPNGVNAAPFVNKQSGAASKRWVLFTRSDGGVRDLWRMRADGTAASALTSSTTLQTWDDHDQSWTPDGRILYVTGESSGADNIYVLTAGDDPPGDALTTYGGIVEIDSPRWCVGWDWAEEVNKNRIVFARRAGPSDDWDLFIADPTDFDATLTRLTDTDDIDELNPSWSPYCDRIVYVSNGDGSYDVWHMSYDASDFDSTYSDVTNRITNDDNIEHNPIWRPSTD